MKDIIKCDTCVYEFYCTTYFNCFKKKYRKLEVLVEMCRNFGGYKKISKLCIRDETKDPCINCDDQECDYPCKERIKYLYREERKK